MSSSDNTPVISEQVVYIDTRDRNMTHYPNPFHFVIEFGGIVGSRYISIPLTIRDMYYLRFRTIILPARLCRFAIDRYFVLRIKELDIPQRYHSNPNLNPSTDIILYNVGINGPNVYLESRTDIRFPLGIGSRLQRLTFEFLDSIGRPLVANSNAGSPEKESWDIVFRHLLSCECPDEFSSPEFDPQQMLNNLFIEMHLGVTTR